jgi:hypothetical protein
VNGSTTHCFPFRTSKRLLCSLRKTADLLMNEAIKNLTAPRLMDSSSSYAFLACSPHLNIKLLQKVGKMGKCSPFYLLSHYHQTLDAYRKRLPSQNLHAFLYCSSSRSSSHSLVYALIVQFSVGGYLDRNNIWPCQHNHQPSRTLDRLSDTSSYETRLL